MKERIKFNKTKALKRVMKRLNWEEKIHREITNPKRRVKK